MTILSTTLIAAAGNAAGGGNYWVNEIIPPDTQTYITRVAVNPSKETIILGSNRVDAANRVMYEFDYDGNILRQGQHTPDSGSATYSYSLARGMNDQYLDSHADNNTHKITRYDSATSGSIQRSQAVKYNGYGTYYNIYYHAPRGTIYSDDDYCLIPYGGYTNPYYTGYGYLFQPYFGVGRFTYTSAGTVAYTNDYMWELSIDAYSDSRSIQVSEASSTGWHIIRGWHYSGRTYWHSFRGSQSGTEAVSRWSQIPSNTDGVAILVDSEDKFFDVIGLTSVKVFRNTSIALPNGYYPNIYWNVVPSFSSGNCCGADLDSSDNLYIMWNEGYIAKFNSSMVLEWVVRVQDTQSSVESNASSFGSFGIKTIDGEDVIFASLTQSSKSGQSTKNINLFRLPINLDEYTGTYDHYSITSAGSISVTSTGVSPQATSNGNAVGANTTNFNAFSNITTTSSTITNTEI